MRIRAKLVLGLAVASLIISSATRSIAQDDDSKQLIKELAQRLDKVERELARLKAAKGEAPTDPKAQKVLTLLESPFLGRSYYGSSNGSRFFVAKLIFINLTTEIVTINQADFSLLMNDKETKLEELPSQMQYQSFQIGNRNFTLRELKTEAKLSIKPGGTGSTWLVFTGLDKGGDVPEMTVNIKNIGANKATKSVSINEHSLSLLNLQVERIGPRRSLGLLTIGGRIDTINLAAIVNEIETMVEQNVVRFVVRWTDKAAPVDSGLMNWLTTSANQAGMAVARSTNEQYPIMPVRIRELHLAEIPGNASRTVSYSSTLALRIHKTTPAAVAAALKSAYERLPLPELLQAITDGHKMTRVAALASGGGRLPASQLPMILKHADDDDPQFQRAALMALRHFGEPVAIKKLVEIAKKDTKQSAIAIESLASSRFAVAHDELLELLKNETPGSAKKIVTILARYPRAAWSETIYKFAADPNSGITSEAMKALAQIGHPKLLDVLKDSLASSSKPLQTEAFGILVARVDSESEDVAMKFTLDHIQDTMPTSQMYTLLGRTKDQRAIPHLIRHFESAGSSRSQLISTLSMLGGKDVVATFLKKYDQLETSEQSAVLGALAQLQVPEFRKLAEQALKSNNDTAIRSATNALKNDGSNQAVDILAAAFKNVSRTNSLSYIATALGNIGTPKARLALQEGLKSTNASKRSYSSSALTNLEARSPGYQFVAQGRALTQQKKVDEAIQQFNEAVKADDQLSTAYAGRGHAYLVKGDREKALADFEKTIELNQFNSVAVTGKGICLVLTGKLDEGIKVVEDARKRFPSDNLYAYNAACMYARALAYVTANEKVADRDKKLAEYKKLSLTELQRAVTLGFRNFDHIKEDEDLTALRETEEFKKIVAGKSIKPRVRPKL